MSDSQENSDNLRLILLGNSDLDTLHFAMEHIEDELVTRTREVLIIEAEIKYLTTVLDLYDVYPPIQETEREAIHQLNSKLFMSRDLLVPIERRRDLLQHQFDDLAELVNQLKKRNDA